MAFNGSGSVSAAGTGTGGGSSASSGDGPHNKRLCTGKENNEAGLNNNRVSYLFMLNFSRHFFLVAVCVCSFSADRFRTAFAFFIQMFCLA